MMKNEGSATNMKPRKGKKIIHPSASTVIKSVVILTHLIHATANAEVVFDKVKPIVWLKTETMVGLGVAEYDIHFAYTNPCKLFEQNVVNNLKQDQQLNEDDKAHLQAYYQNCNALYLTEWETEVDQLVEVQLPTHATDVISKPPEPYHENGKRRKRDAPIIEYGGKPYKYENDKDLSEQTKK